MLDKGKLSAAAAAWVRGRRRSLMSVVSVVSMVRRILVGWGGARSDDGCGGEVGGEVGGEGGWGVRVGAAVVGRWGRIVDKVGGLEAQQCS